MGNSRTRARTGYNHGYLIRAPGTVAPVQIFAYFNPSFGSHMRENAQFAWARSTLGMDCPGTDLYRIGGWLCGHTLLRIILRLSYDTNLE
uniref:HDC09886 n=1 Tax=Drosophila melanogaster TaxID=7227 RepID=Q6ILA7_DROME|nr:TPA_inf: HDC09886 [Drosophila melanogaster]